ncbi:MAG: AbrB/MazE/SpoVT family DNA-binding domain-containing protein [Lachnospiraceae bacterium]|nr:AbrB/MazE/SpoVT family DNA-binding domain-containing protein [Lachnospiraceae bacterium]
MDSVSLKAWGNSQGIIISKKIMRLLGLELDDTLDVEVRNDEIVLKKAYKHKKFEERLAEYNGEISIFEMDWGEPKGRELI